jgi:hypothetical protein
MFYIITIDVCSSYNLNRDRDPRQEFIPTKNKDEEEICLASIREDS